MTPRAPTAIPLTTQWPTSSAVPHIQQIWSQGICGWHPSRLPNSRRVSRSSPTCPPCRSILISSLLNLYPHRGPLLSLPRRVYFIIHPPSPFISLHLISGLGVNPRTPPLFNNNKSLPKSTANSQPSKFNHITHS